MANNENIKIEFINAIDGSIISITEAPAEKLPESFEQPITMNLKGDKWSVVAADPVHSKDFLKTKSLKLRLRKIENKNPKELLFSLPTISEELPEVTTTNVYAGEALSIKEDDWRQHEFLDRSAAPLIKVECDKIESIRQDHSKKLNDTFTAYAKCHSRNSIGSPNLNIELDTLTKILGYSDIAGLKFAGTESYVLNGFSIATDHSRFYGIVQDGIVSTLCVVYASDETLDEIQGLLDQLDLVYVGWCAGVVEWKKG